MDFLSAWWAALPLFEKAMWTIAVPSTILTVLQVVTQLIGAGDHDLDMDGGADVGDLDGDDVSGHDAVDGFHLFSVKGIIIFFTAFSWIGIGIYRAGFGGILAVLIGSVVGVLCMTLLAWIFLMLHRLSETGNFEIKNTLAKKGKVYLKIPEKRTGRGKITMVVQSSSRELMAMTDGDEISTGASIQVIDIIDDTTVLVAKD